MLKAVVNRRRRVRRNVRAVHRLEKELAEPKILEPLRLGSRLRGKQLPLVSGPPQQRGSRLRAHANPVDAVGRGSRAVGLYGHFESLRVKRVNRAGVKLQQGLTAG